MNIATAGHVDHGKTSLVKALTQIDTDRLAEEKRRGMSIDLGFAYADFSAEAPPVGFIDVPGHERFMRNMLAGVACIDVALLVIAADDGPMPQTREHLAVLELLGVPQAVVALTKIDRIGPDRLAQVRDEIRRLLGSGPYRDAPLFPLVATRGEGVPALREHLAEAARSLPRRKADGHFRLAVDRSFSLPGAGRIVTGAALSGRVRVGDTVIVSPQGNAVRVRAVHAQNRPAESAKAGQRCALNLAGGDLKNAAPARGDWIVAPAVHAPTQRIDALVTVLASEPKPLTERAALHLHLGAAAIAARVAPLFARSIAPGETGLVQLLLDAPIAALAGDRFILRETAAQRTIGGGRVLDPFGPARGRSKAGRQSQLAALALPGPALALAALLESEPAGLDPDRFALAWNLTQGEINAALHGLPVEPIIERNGSRRMIGSGPWHALRDGMRDALAALHAEQPDSIGPSLPVLAARLRRRDAPGLLQAAIASLVDEGAVQRDGLRFRLAGHRAVLSEADDALLGKVAALLRPAALRAPIVGDLALSLALPLPVLLTFLEQTGRLGRLVRVAPNRYYLPETIADLLAVAKQLAAASDDGRFDTAAFRDRSGIGRNLSVQVLEFMDREGLTRFDGERRVPIG